MKLNLGCGRNPIAGYVNIDRADLPGVDVVHDLETFPLPFDDDTFDEIVGIDLIEHITDALGLMAELWRIAKPGAVCAFGLPYGSSDDAWEDPTHVRPYFINSWGYFSQPYYWRAQYNTKDEYDLFGRRVHPSPLCPWHVSDALSANEGPWMDGSDQGSSPEWAGEVLEGRLHLGHRSEGSVKDNPGASTGDGDTSRPTTPPVGERSPHQRAGGRQLLEELGTLVQDAASRSKSRGLAELARLLIPGGIAPTPELGESGCVCTYADYGYRGDWQPETLVLDVKCEGDTSADVMAQVMALRNVVSRQTVTLRAVKPARPCDRNLIVGPKIELRR